MALLDRIANYFREWDGIDDTAPKIELNIHELRYIADMNVERCRLIRQLNELNIKKEEIRAKAIDEFAEALTENAPRNWAGGLELNGMVDYLSVKQIKEIAEQVKGVQNE